jgi:hypothetical protein
MGGRKLRFVEFGASGVLGQLRTSGVITTPGQEESPNRRVVDVRGLGLDAQLALTKGFGLLGEFYVGQGLGEYSGGVIQSFNSTTFAPIHSRGWFAEAYVYLKDKLHVHGGYGIDNPSNDDLATLQIPRNQTGFANVYWDLSKIIQLSLEVEYRKTNFFAPLLTSSGEIFMPQMLFRF